MTKQIYTKIIKFKKKKILLIILLENLKSMEIAKINWYRKWTFLFTWHSILRIKKYRNINNIKKNKKYSLVGQNFLFPNNIFFKCVLDLISFLNLLQNAYSGIFIYLIIYLIVLYKRFSFIYNQYNRTILFLSDCNE